MNKRKGTPSLMDDLLGGKKKNPDNMPASQFTSKPSFEEPPLPTEAKAKATFYINQDILYELEAAQLQLRRLSPMANKKELSKSAIVEAALQIVLDEMKTNASHSQLALYFGRE